MAIESDGRIKIALATPLDATIYKSTSTSVTWASSNLYSTLNGTYYNSLSERGYMVYGTWYAGTVSYGASSSGVRIDATDDQENVTAVTALVGMPNITDYLKASTSCSAATTWNTLNNSPYTCKNNNWLYNSANSYWFMNPYSTTRARFRNTSGAVSLNPSTGYNYGVMPVVYLSADTLLKGAGTSSNPFTLNSQCGRVSATAATCSISTTSGYEASKVLTITASGNGATLHSSPFSWDSSTWTSSSTTTVTNPYTYRAYVRDTNNGFNSCTITLSGQTEYRKASCSRGWYSWKAGSPTCCAYMGDGSCNSYINYTKAYAESNNLSYYYSCGASSQCDYDTGYVGSCMKYTRSCYATNCGSFGSWSTTASSNTCTQKVETRITIGY